MQENGYYRGLIERLFHHPDFNAIIQQYLE